MAKAKRYQPGKRESLRTALISFDEDHELHGLELTVRLNADMALFLQIVGLTEMGPSVGPETIKQFASALTDFGDRCLVDWNVDDDAGNPIPANGAGFLRQDLDFVMAIIGAWVAEVSTPSAPLVQPSPGGSTSEAA